MLIRFDFNLTDTGFVLTEISLKQIEFLCQVNACVIEKRQRDLRLNKKKAVNYIKGCFESLLNDDDFLK